MGYDSDKDQHYLDLLRSSRYEESSGSPSIAFGYESGDDNPLLRQLRVTYDLDGMAGRGTEAERLLSLLTWVHNAVKYDGGPACYMPPEKNALHILAHPLSAEKGVNCRMMAIVLNEALLALGWRSRFVTCIAHDVSDPDAHVVVTVFAQTLGRWIMLDPAFNAYLTDGQGRIVGLQEVRAAMIAGRPIGVSPGIGLNPGPGLDWWDGADLATFYLGYMSKNLYRLETPVLSEFNYESVPKDRFYCSLQPLGYSLAGPKVVRTASGFRNLVVTTSRPEDFWAPPE